MIEGLVYLTIVFGIPHSRGGSGGAAVKMQIQQFGPMDHDECMKVAIAITTASPDFQAVCGNNNQSILVLPR
ncbi:hypothetical protein PMI42_07451 [Bradyrhizobium sp. YR681]|uniref:hypothetical protein n=1 Tax=Bradyrhizobium sp. YR681 TaxID=1144344 RepID=UPI00026F8F39|nr:hypothetical protein [Bradyrhizobium sp. YR681]EJN07921.1 hypothetical protein PMI42_07451 [Bradyrhizobium sp. YR681]